MPLKNLKNRGKIRSLQKEDEGKLVRAMRVAAEDDECRPPQDAHRDGRELRTITNPVAAVLEA